MISLQLQGTAVQGHLRPNLWRVLRLIASACCGVGRMLHAQAPSTALTLGCSGLD